MNKIQNIFASFEIMTLSNFYLQKKATPLSFEETVQIVEWIRHNFYDILMLVYLVKQPLQSAFNFLTKLCPQLMNCQSQTLKRHQVDIFKYKISIEKYQQQSPIKEYREQLFELALNAVQGRQIDFKVPQIAFQTISYENFLKINHELNLHNYQCFLQKIAEKRTKNPDSSQVTIQQTQYMRQNKTQIQFLYSRGFKPQWGHPVNLLARMKHHYLHKQNKGQLRQMMIQHQQTNSRLVSCWKKVDLDDIKQGKTEQIVQKLAKLQI